MQENRNYQPSDLIKGKEQSEGLTVVMTAISQSSEKHPDHNEDNFFFDQPSRIAGVFDGVGGRDSGEVASWIAADLGSHLQNLPTDLDLMSCQEQLGNLLTYANKQILQRADRLESKMATTATLAKILETREGKIYLIIANVGDSRAYLYNNGQLQCLTLDDNQVSEHFAGNYQQAKAAQDRLDNVVSADGLNDLDLVLFNNRNKLSQALGYEGMRPHIYTKELQTNDIVLLCSDGISDNLTSKEIAAILASASLGSAKQQLVEQATRRSRQVNNEGKRHPRAKKDDMTAVLMQLQKDQNENNPEMNRISKKIAAAKSFPELYKVLQEIGSLQGSRKLYSAQDLIQVIERLRNEQAIFREITKTAGLRDKVQELYIKYGTVEHPTKAAAAENKPKKPTFAQGLKRLFLGKR